MGKFWRVVAALLALLCVPASAKDSLRILSWDGYVTAEDLTRINKLLGQQGYDIEARLIKPYAEGAEQMYNLMREGKVDIAFLTLFFIKLQGEKSTNILQPIDTASPRLSNYKHLLPDLTRIPMGMRDQQVLYIPFSGGSYGFYVNRRKVAQADVPLSWGELFTPRWKGKYSLNKSQVWYNVAIAAMALGRKPYYINDLAVAGQRDRVIEETSDGSPLAEKLAALYRGAGDFWLAAPTFPDRLDIVSSWGPDLRQANQLGGDWRLIRFREGDLVWMDTINFVAGLADKRLEAAEIVANYLIGREVQSRVAGELSLVSVSALARTNPILKRNPKFFTSGAFVPPYDTIADNAMTQMSHKALMKLEGARK